MYENYLTKSSDETRKLGREFFCKLNGGNLVLLYGELGCGKTQFTKGIADGMNISEVVTSPTFMIERIYESPEPNKQKQLTLHHFDLYRTNNDREILDEIQDLLRDKSNIVVVEWPENMKALLDLKHVSVRFNYLNENERQITIGEKL